MTFMHDDKFDTLYLLHRINVGRNGHMLEKLQENNHGSLYAYGSVTCMDHSLEQKGDTLAVGIQSSDSMSLIRTRSQKGQVSKAEMAQESRSKMVGKLY